MKTILELEKLRKKTLAKFGVIRVISALLALMCAYLFGWLIWALLKNTNKTKICHEATATLNVQWGRWGLRGGRGDAS